MERVYLELMGFYNRNTMQLLINGFLFDINVYSIVNSLFSKVRYTVKIVAF